MLHTQSVLCSILIAYLQVYSPASWEYTIESNWKCPWEYAPECSWECTWRCTGECTWDHPDYLLESVRQSGWQCAIVSNWDLTVNQAGSVHLSAIWSIPQSILGSMQCSVSGSLLASLFYAAWCIVCSVMYSIQCTISHQYYSNLVIM